MGMGDAGDVEDDNRRRDELEAFVGEVDDWAETIQILLLHWRDENSAALAAYVDQMRARIRALKDANPDRKRRRGDE